MLTKRANPVEQYNQQNIHFAIKHFKLQIYLIAQIKLWSTRSELLVTKMSLHSTLCVYAIRMYICMCNVYCANTGTNVLFVLLGHCDSQCKLQNILRLFVELVGLVDLCQGSSIIFFSLPRFYSSIMIIFPAMQIVIKQHTALVLLLVCYGGKKV